MLINAKEELLSILEELDIPIESILKAKIGWRGGGFYRESTWSDGWEFIYLTTSNTVELLGCLDVTYDSGYGSQELDGHIVISKELWLSRGEYDGSESWVVHQCPEI
jgi:hypothetical protein